MTSFSIKRSAPIVAAFTITSLAPLTTWAQATALPPARTYYTDVNGKQLGVKERWGLDANGERHGKYLRFNENGLLVNSATYVHGAQTGAGVIYNNLVSNFYNSFQKRPDTKFVGNYRNGVTVGTWMGYRDNTQEHVVTLVFDEMGKQQSATYYQNEKVVKTEKTPSPAPSSGIKVSPVAPMNFYAFASGEQAKFEKMTFQQPNDAGPITGAELLKTDALKTATIAQYLEANNDAYVARLLLRASKLLGANPSKLLITNSNLTQAQLYPMLGMESAQLDGELIYYGLRGSEDEKGHGSNLLVQRLIQARSNKSDMYKQELAANFCRCAKAANDAYADTTKYTLRRWLYEEYKDADPLKWMNKITKSDPQNDQIQFPKLYGN
jgi:hypothetical protein